MENALKSVGISALFGVFFAPKRWKKCVKNGIIRAVKNKGSTLMTEHEELLKLRALVEKQEALLAAKDQIIGRQSEQIEKQNARIEKQNIQI